MRINRFLFLLLLPYAAQASFFDSDCPEAPISSSGVSFETAFTPGDHISEQVIKSITAAKSSIRVAAHRFVSKDVSVALLQAARSGKDVRILLDNAGNKDGYSDATFFINMSRPPHSLKNYNNQYQDYILIDGKDLIIGNISSLQEISDEKKNAASVLVIHNVPELVKKYTENWETLWESSEVMTNPNLIQVKTKKSQ